MAVSPVLADRVTHARSLRTRTPPDAVSSSAVSTPAPSVPLASGEADRLCTINLLPTAMPSSTTEDVISMPHSNGVESTGAFEMFCDEAVHAESDINPATFRGILRFLAQSDKLVTPPAAE